jgi:crossover junction endodeoxyribonuclease RuvC
MRILGIDPGLRTIGLGLIEAQSRSQVRSLEWLTIQTDAALGLPDRLAEIARDLDGFLEGAKPDLAVVERIYFAVNERTAIDVAHARGVLLQTVAARSIPILEPTPLELKAAVTGDGSADKRQIGDMLVRIFKLPAPPTPDDAADALALAYYGALAGASPLTSAARAAESSPPRRRSRA